MADLAKDRIFLKECRFQVHIGVTEEERKKPQEIILDLSWTTDLRAAGVSDQLSETVCYFELWTQVKEHLEGQTCRLLEHLAQSLSAVLFERFQTIESLSLRISKPGALSAQQVACAGIEIERSRTS
jgi:FolB domain-containing protein